MAPDSRKWHGCTAAPVRHLSDARSFNGGPLGGTLWVRPIVVQAEERRIKRTSPMAVTVELSPEKEAALASQARAAHMPPERYLAEIVERALEIQQRRAAETLGRHLDSMAATISPETTADEMEAALEEALD